MYSIIKLMQIHSNICMTCLSLWSEVGSQWNFIILVDALTIVDQVCINLLHSAKYPKHCHIGRFSWHFFDPKMDKATSEYLYSNLLKGNKFLDVRLSASSLENSRTLSFLWPTDLKSCLLHIYKRHWRP